MFSQCGMSEKIIKECGQNILRDYDNIDDVNFHVFILLDLD